MFYPFTIGYMKNTKKTFTSTLLLRERTKRVKRSTAFKAKIMLENDELRKEISTKVWRKQLA